MSSTLLQYLPAATGILVLMAAFALSLGGVALVTYGASAFGAEVARRVRLVRPPDHAADHAPDKHATTPTLIRARVGGAAERNRGEISRRLARFHISEGHALSVYLSIRLALVVCLGALFFLALPFVPAFAASSLLIGLGTLAGCIAGWFIPAIVLRRFVNRHVNMVVSGLPDALELLVICVEAGLSLEDSLTRIVREMRVTHPGLAAELALTSADLKILPSREQAFAHLASRIDVPSIRSVVTTLSQTMRFGTPLAQALRMVASEMRNDALIAMEGRANRLPALLTVPMMLFIMPTIFLIVGGPAALRVADTFLK